MENLERFRLQCVCLLQFELRGFVLFCRREQHSETEVQLNVWFVRRREFARRLQGLAGLFSLKIGANQIEPRFNRRRVHVAENAGSL